MLKGLPDKINLKKKAWYNTLISNYDTLMSKINKRSLFWYKKLKTMRKYQIT